MVDDIELSLLYFMLGAVAGTVITCIFFFILTKREFEIIRHVMGLKEKGYSDEEIKNAIIRLKMKGEV